jgi:hypothetical protein
MIHPVLVLDSTTDNPLIPNESFNFLKVTHLRPSSPTDLRTYEDREYIIEKNPGEREALADG